MKKVIKLVSNNMVRDSKGSLVAWLALAISVFSLWIAWTTYNQVSEERLEDMIQQKASEAYQQIEERLNQADQATSSEEVRATTTSTTSPTE